MKSADVQSTVFKVPKIKTKEYLEKVSLSSTQYKLEIFPNIVSNFKKPELSQKKLNITSVWLINNKSAEERYIKRRVIMKKEMPRLSYSVGFMYISDYKKLQDIARTGRIEVGNIKKSNLGKSSMGVSLCLYADIYHPGYQVVGIPDKGYLLLVKYLKGKINYVPCDDLPMDPQPNYDCHMVKSPMINANVSCETAYHQSQIFIYEYTDDGEIVRHPSKLLPFAAVQFNWIGSPLFKLINTPSQKSKEIKDTHVQELKTTYLINIQNERHVAAFSVHKKNASSTVEFDLTIHGFKDNKMRSNAFLYFTHPILSLLKSDYSWEISGIIECSEFEKEFKRLQLMWHGRESHSSPLSLNDPLSQDIIISLNRPNLLRSVDVNNEATCFNDFSNIPQFVTYTRVTIEDYQRSKRLIEFFNLTKTMGFINRPNEPDISILLFPDGKLSQKLGIPCVSDLYYFHGLVFHSQNPQFIIRNNNTSEKRKEMALYFSCLSSYKKQSIQSKFKTLEPLIDSSIFKQTIKSQAEMQKYYLFKVLKPHCNSPTTDYKAICFSKSCEDIECMYHYPIKKIKLNEYIDKENIEDSMQSSSPLPMISKIKQRHCLSEKLLDYFKTGAECNDVVEEGEVVLADERKDIVPMNFNFKNGCHNLVNGTPSIKFSKRCSVKSKKICYQDDRGSFFPLEFFRFNSARYYGTNCFKIMNFSFNDSSFSCESSDSLCENIWSLNQNRFKRNEISPIISTYD